MTEPTGTHLDVVLDNQKRRIYIGTNIFCPATIHELMALRKAQMKEEMEDLRLLKDVLPEEEYKLKAKRVLEDWDEVKSNNPEAASKVLLTRDALIVVLHNSSPDISSKEEAAKVYDSLESYTDLINAIFSVHGEVAEAAKNSSPPSKIAKELKASLGEPQSATTS